MEPENHTTSSPEPNYKKTNILVGVFIVFSIIPALQSFGITALCVIVDVFAVLGIISARNPDSKIYLINPYLFPFVGILGILLLLASIGNLVVEVTGAHLDTLILAIYFVLVGMSFFLNRWERIGKIF